jgi:hypothetical protein
MNRKAFWLLSFLISAMGNSVTADAAVHALFELRSPTMSPFPSNWFTVPDRSNNTGVRVNLPLPDCAKRQSDCEDLAVINTLDGFNVQPQLSIPFDGAIDVTTVTSRTVFLVRLSSTERDDDNDCDDVDSGEGACEARGPVIGINQIVWDTFTNTLHVESNELLDQHTRYAVIVTDQILDREGRPVEASESFRRFRQMVRGKYKQALLDALRAARRQGIPERDIVAASVFVTQTVTSVLEKMRDQIKAATPQAADFNLGPGGSRTVFPIDAVAGITWNQQTGADPPAFTTVQLPVDDLLRIIPGAVGTIAFGKYSSPDYQVHPGEFIPPIGTRTGSPMVQGTNEIYFNLYLPSGPKPANGWPVAIFGHGNGASKEYTFAAPGSGNVAATMAAHGIATIAINATGAGFGSLGTLTVNQTAGDPVTFSSGGRGIDQNGDHIIDANEGLSAAPPRTILLLTDGVRQTVADLMQLVQLIEVGIDVDGDGLNDLDPSRIYYFGWSLGANYGTVFLGVEPSVQVGVLTSPGSPTIENRRLAALFLGRDQLGLALASRTPSLINEPGIMSLDGVAVGPPYFNDNFPLRDGIPLHVRLADGTSRDIQSPVLNEVEGAMAIQDVIENTKWVDRSGDPVAYAPYVRKAPLAGVAAKSVVYQFGKGDQLAPNPNATAVVRAGDLADRTTFYRHDLAFAENPTLPRQPHGFMIRIDIPAFREIALQAQAQIAVFFASDGTEIIHPEPARFFEVPIVLPLPEALNYIP